MVVLLTPFRESTKTSISLFLLVLATFSSPRLKKKDMAFKGEAFVVASFQVILEMVASPIIKEIIFRLGIDKEIKRLGKMLAKIQDVLDDAEQEQEQQQRKPSVEMWLNELKDFAYDVDDVMDEFAYEIERLKLKGDAETDIIDEVCSLFSSLNISIDRFSFEQMIASKIKDLIKRLENLEETRVMLGLREGVGGRWIESRERRKTSSVFDESDFVGRVDDRDVLIGLLLDKPIRTTHIDKKHKFLEKNYSVIPIVGMGGHGKTTLVQALYNDERVQKYFDIKAWVCVSEDFDVRRLTQAILESAAPTRECNVKSLDALHVSLKNKLREKKFLLVLDDVWSENQHDWDDLRAPFGVGAPGSKIVVTTRSQKVSLLMGTFPPYKIQGLLEEDCWSLFKQRAFAEENSNREDLEIIGMKIVKKCKGSPLAVKTLGGLLHSIEDVEKWEHVLNTEMWNLKTDSRDILPALRLSYHHLPSHLKQCFAYCSIFPKDYEIKKEKLVRLWIAQGFVQPEGRRCLEDIGKEYFDDLFLRSFFQPSSNSSNWNKEFFVMHDLIHDLAQSISEKICCRLENHLSDNITITERTRHVSLGNLDNVENLLLFYKAKSLRTIFLWGKAEWEWKWKWKLEWEATLQSSHDFFEKLKYLRVLCLQISSGIGYIESSIFNLKHLRYLELYLSLNEKGEGKMLPADSIGGLLNLQILILHNCTTELPNSIGKLKKLRYLELFYFYIMMRLPESIAGLLNLHTLKLHDNSSMHKEFEKNLELPKDIRNLNCLRNLDMRGCVRLASLPVGIGKLTNIQTLSKFPVSRDSGAKLGELKDMNKLCGFLHISGLENIIDVDEAKDATLKNKQHLKELRLEWNYSEEDPSLREPSVEELVLESLEPHTNLEDLHISGNYGGARLPKWMGDPSFSKLKRITIEGGGECCQVLPALGQLPLLIYLQISNVLGLKHMGPEFYGMGKSFPSLETLELYNLPELEEWFGLEKDGDFLCLCELTITKCPKLRNLPDAFPALEKLDIEFCNRLVDLPTFSAIKTLSKLLCKELEVLPTFDTLKQLSINSCERLVILPNFPALEGLSISSCNLLEDLPTFPALKELTIEECGRLVALPAFPALKELDINSCEGLKVLQSYPALKKLIIWSCKGLENLPTFLALKELSINYSDRVDLPTFPALKKLEINSCEGRMVLPNFPALEELKIYSCKGLEVLPRLLALCELALTFCDDNILKSLPNFISLSKSSSSTTTEISRGTLSTMLQYLRISDFPILEALPLKDFTSLKKLQIWNCPKLVSFSEELLPTTLKHLAIRECPIKHLPKGLQNLLSLETLEIDQCHSLESFPEDGLPTSIRRLRIFNCKLLQIRCRKGGEDWPKMSHIPEISYTDSLSTIW